MADTTPPTTDTAELKKPARRRQTTPAKGAAKPRATRAKAEPAAASTTPTKPKAKAPPKPRSSKRQAPAMRTQKAATVAKEATSKVGGKWGAAAIAGGLAAAGAAAAALLTLRGSTPKEVDKTGGHGGAHQPDGTDASKSFQAGIADENTIPDRV